MGIQYFLESIKEDILKLEELGATEIEIEQDDGCIFFNAYQERIETDEEFEARKLHIQLKEKEVEEQELKKLAELKAKYENQQ